MTCQLFGGWPFRCSEQQVFRIQRQNLLQRRKIDCILPLTLSNRHEDPGFYIYIKYYNDL